MDYAIQASCAIAALPLIDRLRPAARMKFRRGSFFGRLLTAFFLGGFIPFLILAVLFVTLARGILEKTYGERARKAVEISASMFDTLLSGTFSVARGLAASPAIVTYCEGARRNAAIISDVNKLLASAAGSSGLLPFVIPADGASILSRTPPPEEYMPKSHDGWGILGKLSRSEEEAPIVVFAQPHPSAGRAVSLAVGTLVRGTKGRSGYLVIDVDRKLLEEKIGQTVKSSGALTGLVLADETGCIVYDMADPRKEATFYDEVAFLQKSFFTPSAAAIMGIEAHGVFPKKAVQEYAQRIIAAAVAIAAASALIFIVVAVLLAKSTSKPIHLLTLTMKDVSEGRLDVSCPEIQGAGPNDEVGTLIRQFNWMIARVNELVDSKVEQERSLRYAELKALQAQINPHFIYNTLNLIRSVAKLKGDKELAFISTSLAKILREGSSSGSDYCSLEHSLELARDYFAIEAWRWPGRFRLDEAIDPAISDARIPRLIVQPLVENALAHGLENKPGPGLLSIRGGFEGGDLVLVISDDGVGIDEGRLAAIRANLARAEEGEMDLSIGAVANGPAGLKTIGDRNGGEGIGLLNTHRRLRLIYGKSYGLTIGSKRGEGTAVTVRLPYSAGEEESCSK